MGQSGSKESQYGRPQPGHPHYGPMRQQNGFIPTDPYAGRQPNTLPRPPREPLPQPPHPSTFSPRQHRDEGSGSGSRTKNLFRAFTSKRPGHERTRSESLLEANRRNVWTYPDGTPFPTNAELPDVGRRPSSHVRSQSFSGSGNKRKNSKAHRVIGLEDDQADAYAEYGYGNGYGNGGYGYGGGYPPQFMQQQQQQQQQQQPATSWRDRLPERFRRDDREDGYYSDRDRDLNRKGSYGKKGKHHYRRASVDGAGSRRRAPLQNVFQQQQPMNMGVSNMGYTRVEDLPGRTWTYPDGTPFVEPGQMNMNGAAAPVPAEMMAGEHRIHAGTPSVDEPRVYPPDHPLNPNRQHQHFPSIPNPIPAAPQPLTSTPGGVPGEVARLADPAYTFCFDRKHDFSHYSYHAVKFVGKIWPSVYHLWEAMKYLDGNPVVARRIRRCERIRDVVGVVKEVGNAGVRADWDTVYLRKMEEALQLKFTQHPQILDALLSTSPKKLLFLSMREPFWGWSTATAEGENQLGQCLERVRERMLREGGSQVGDVVDIEEGMGMMPPGPGGGMGMGMPGGGGHGPGPVFPGMMPPGPGDGMMPGDGMGAPGPSRLPANGMGMPGPSRMPVGPGDGMQGNGHGMMPRAGDGYGYH